MQKQTLVKAGGNKMAKFKPKHKELIEFFLQTFLPDTRLTGSEYKMVSIKMSNVKKVVKAFIVENNIETEKTTEHIIWECIQYASMKGMKLRSPASLGYAVLNESINYWKKHEEMLARKEEEEKQEQKQTEEEERLAKLVEENMKKRQGKKVPKWMLDD